MISFPVIGTSDLKSNIVQQCTRYCEVLHGIDNICCTMHIKVWCFLIFYGIAWYCMVLHGIVWYCMVSYDLGQVMCNRYRPTAPSISRLCKTTMMMMMICTPTRVIIFILMITSNRFKIIMIIIHRIHAMHR